MAGLHGHTNKPTHRVYSFVQPGMCLGRRGRLRLEILSGPSFTVSAPELGVRVLWLPTPDSALIDREATALAFKRKAYWRNTNRNDFIAAVARTFAKQDLGKLGEYGVPFQGYEAVLRNAPLTNVAVLVASTEQARNRGGLQRHVRPAGRAGRQAEQREYDVLGWDAGPEPAR